MKREVVDATPESLNGVVDTVKKSVAMETVAADMVMTGVVQYNNNILKERASDKSSFLSQVMFCFTYEYSYETSSMRER